MQKTPGLRSYLFIIPATLSFGCAEAPRQTPEELQSCRNTLNPKIPQQNNPRIPENRSDLFNNFINFVRSNSLNAVNENSTEYLYEFFGGYSHTLLNSQNGGYTIYLQTPGKGSASDLIMSPWRRFYTVDFRRLKSNKILFFINIQDSGENFPPNADYMENVLSSGWQRAAPIYSTAHPLSRPPGTTWNAWTRWITSCYLGSQEIKIQIELDQNGSLLNITAAGDRHAPQ